MKTIQQISTSEITIKGSRFIAYAHPVSSSQSALEVVAHYKALHPKARHWCYSYRLGIKGEDYRANDDGEPAGTAGLPILQQLQSLELSDSVCVVVRYFGGTLLGVSGLIKAYKQSAREALRLAPTVEMVAMQTLRVRCAYSEMNAVLGLCKRHQAVIIRQTVDFQTEITVQLPEPSALELQSALQERRFEVVAVR